MVLLMAETTAAQALLAFCRITQTDYCNSSRLGARGGAALTILADSGFPGWSD